MNDMSSVSVIPNHRDLKEKGEQRKTQKERHRYVSTFCAGLVWEWAFDDWRVRKLVAGTEQW